MNPLTNLELLRAVMNEPEATTAERLLADRLWGVIEELDDVRSDMAEYEAKFQEIHKLLP